MSLACIPVERKRVFYLFRRFQPAFAELLGREGGVSTLWPWLSSLLFLCVYIKCFFSFLYTLWYPDVNWILHVGRNAH
jgi:hypothetical protein